MKVNHERTAGRSRLTRTLICVMGLALVVVLAVVGRVLYGRPAGEPSAEVAKAGTRSAVAVVVTPAAIRQFERSVVVQGNVEAKNLALVSPRIGGTIEAIFVEEGDSVVAGQTKLFAVDQANLERAVQISEQALAVARFATEEKQANLERVQADFAKAELDYGRFKRLVEKQAVTQDAFEQQRSRYQQLQAMLKHARTLVELSKAQESQAQVALEVAGKNLADAVVYAPISGRISERLHEPGEMGNPGNAVVRIDDTAIVEVSAYLPSQYYAEVVCDRTVMAVRVAGAALGEQSIRYKSPTIDPRLRTFEIKSLIENPPEGIVPGAMADIVVVFEKRQGMGVPAQAIQTRGGQSVVFSVREGIARQVALKTGLETAGWTEVVDGALDAGTPVITMGQYSVAEGTPVSVQEE